MISDIYAIDREYECRRQRYEYFEWAYGAEDNLADDKDFDR